MAKVTWSPQLIHFSMAAPSSNCIILIPPIEKMNRIKCYKNPDHVEIASQLYPSDAPKRP